MIRSHTVVPRLRSRLTYWVTWLLLAATVIVTVQLMPPWITTLRDRWRYACWPYDEAAFGRSWSCADGIGYLLPGAIIALLHLMPVVTVAVARVRVARPGGPNAHHVIVLSAGGGSVAMLIAWLLYRNPQLEPDIARTYLLALCWFCAALLLVIAAAIVRLPPVTVLLLWTALACTMVAGVVSSDLWSAVSLQVGLIVTAAVASVAIDRSAPPTGDQRSQVS